MVWTERRRAGRSSPRRAVIATVGAGVTALLASLFWLTIVPSTPAQGAPALTTTAASSPRLDASGTAGTSPGGQSRGHKEGPVAVIASVLAVIAVVVLIVGLRSLALKRRTRNGPSTGGPARGVFDEWFRTRR